MHAHQVLYAIWHNNLYLLLFGQWQVNEYSSLKDGTLYSWGDLGPGPFFLRLGGLWLATFTVLGAPIAAASFNPSRVRLRYQTFSNQHQNIWHMNVNWYHVYTGKKYYSWELVLQNLEDIVSLYRNYTQMASPITHRINEILLYNLNRWFYTCKRYFIFLYSPFVPTLQDPLRFVLAAGTGTLFLVSLIVLRIYLVLFSSLLYLTIITRRHE